MTNYCPHCGAWLACKTEHACCQRPKDEPAGFRLPDELRRIVEQAPHNQFCDSRFSYHAFEQRTDYFKKRGICSVCGKSPQHTRHDHPKSTDRPPCNCWLSRFWAEVERLEKDCLGTCWFVESRPNGQFKAGGRYRRKESGDG